MSLKLYLLRNGETEYSRTGCYCSHDGVPLTTRGQGMADHFAKAYYQLPWTAIFCSPLSHAIATVKPLYESLTSTSGLDIQKRDGLRELDFGQWEGLSPATVDQRFHDDYMRWLADPGWNAPTAGEKGVRVAHRSSAVLDEIENRYPTGNVLIVSHKATLRIMLCTLLGVDTGRYRDRLAMPVAGLTVISMASYGPFVEVFNDCIHLPMHLRPELPGAGKLVGK